MPRILVVALASLALVACAPERRPAPREKAAAAPAASPRAAARAPVAHKVIVSDVTFPSGRERLAGRIWKPAGRGPFPTLVYHHGSGGDFMNKDAVGDFFARNGYVMFQPIRPPNGSASARRRDPVREVERQAGDVSNAILFVRTQSFVDASRIATGGCSAGGIQAVLAAERRLGIRASIDWAGAALYWSQSDALQQRLQRAVENARVPIFFLQAANDADVTPTRALAAIAKRAGKPHDKKIYAAFGAGVRDGHGGFCNRATHVWGRDVLDFLQRHMSSKASAGRPS
jgi:carboxymethylenebutenolidase